MADASQASCSYSARQVELVVFVARQTLMSQFLTMITEFIKGKTK